MATKSELAHMAAQVGLTSQQVASVLAVASLVALFVFRRPIFRVLRFVFNTVFTVGLFCAILAGAAWFYDRFGLLHAAGFIGAVGLFFVLLARIGRSSFNGSGHDADEQDDIDQDHRDHQLRETERRLRETERMQRAHEDIRRRNPW
jgi:hypothetical protein